MGLGDFFKGSQYKAKIAQLEAELQSFQQKSQTELQELNAKYLDLVAQVQNNGMLDLIEIQKNIKNEKSTLNEIQSQISTARSDLQAEIQKKVQEEKKLLNSVRGDVIAAQSELQMRRSQLKEVQQQILGAEDIVLLESFALYEPKYQLTNSAEYKERLSEIREVQKQAAKGISAEIDAWENHAIQLNKTQWKKLRKDALKLALRSFNSESEYCIDNVKFNNMDKMEARIRRSFETCNALLKAMECWWKDVVLERKLQELYLAHEFQIKRQEEKETARQVREDQREQEKLEKEIREARAKIEKERRHFTSALQKLQIRLNAANTQQERDDLQTRIDELSSQNNQLDEQEKLLDYREQNARAGYVYVISNIGAFGEGVYKIGMTRRLEPMDRVDELGDASVPFRFDVHAMVFSDNAPALESKLHSHFATGRLNKINGRKEFFRADLKAIESVIRANYDAVVEVVHNAPAEQYRESLRLTMPMNSQEKTEQIEIA